ncbi:MAG: hypothetical protein HYX86_03540 [Chloroflexi bacterium]|nr:hypothetical protein [Chloroflexota bacterium]
MPEALTAFAIGLLAANSPCVLPLYPGFLALLSGMGAAGRRPPLLLGGLMLSGVLTMMLALGAGAVSLGVPLANTLGVLLPLADLILLLLGVLLILGRNPFQSLPQLRVPALAGPYGNAFVYGLLYGPLVLPCSGPLAVSVFALSFSAQEAFSRLGVFLSFGLGFGLPLVILSLFSGVTQRRITNLLVRNAHFLNKGGGTLLILLAIYHLVSNWSFIQLAWGV